MRSLLHSQRHQLRRVVPGTHGHDDVLRPVHHVRHRQTTLIGGQLERSYDLARLLVVRPEDRSACPATAVGSASIDASDAVHRLIRTLLRGTVPSWMTTQKNELEPVELLRNLAGVRTASRARSRRSTFP